MPYGKRSRRKNILSLEFSKIQKNTMSRKAVVEIEQLNGGQKFNIFWVNGDTTVFDKCGEVIVGKYGLDKEESCKVTNTIQFGSCDYFSYYILWRTLT